jgi:hypothetical protein
MDARHEVIELDEREGGLGKPKAIEFVFDPGLSGDESEFSDGGPEADVEDSSGASLADAGGEELVSQSVHLGTLLSIGGTVGLGGEGGSAVLAEVALDLPGRELSTVEAGSDDASGNGIMNGKGAREGGAFGHYHAA